MLQTQQRTVIPRALGWKSVFWSSWDWSIVGLLPSLLSSREDVSLSCVAFRSSDERVLATGRQNAATVACGLVAPRANLTMKVEVAIATNHSATRRASLSRKVSYQAIGEGLLDCLVRNVTKNACWQPQEMHSTASGPRCSFMQNSEHLLGSRVCQEQNDERVRSWPGQIDRRRV